MKTEKLLLSSLFLIGCAGTIFSTLHLSLKNAPNQKMPRVIESRITSDLQYLTLNTNKQDSIPVKTLNAADKFTN